MILNKSKHLFKYESIFMYSGGMTGQEVECPVSYLPNDNLYLFVKSMYQEAIKDGLLAKDIKSQEELIGENYEEHSKVILD